MNRAHQGFGWIGEWANMGFVRFISLILLHSAYDITVLAELRAPVTAASVYLLWQRGPFTLQSDA